MASPAAARADLEALLRARKLDRTVTRGETSTQGFVATSIADLDAVLGGGFPRGEMSEVVGPRSSGRSSLLCAALAAATTQGEVAALIDTLDMFDAESAAKAGIRLERLLWVRGDALSRHPPAPAWRTRSPMPGAREPRRSPWPSPGAERKAAIDPWTRALERAVKAVNLVLQAGGFDLVVLDLAEVPIEATRRLPFTTWFRLQRTIEGSRTACLLAAPAPVARSAGGVTVELARLPAGERARWSGEAGQFRLFLGLDVEAFIVRSRAAESNACRFTARP